MTPSASDLRGVVPHLRAFAICLVDDQNVADALIEIVLLGTCKGNPRVAGYDTRMRLFNLMHREFHGYESTRALARLPRHPATLPSPIRGMDSTAARSLLRALCPAEREAIVLLDACGFSEGDAGAICECDPLAIRERARNASERLSQAQPAKRSADKRALHLWQAG